MKKTGLVIGAGSEAKHMIEIAKGYGIEVIALDGDPAAKGLRYADRCEIIDISDTQKVCHYIDTVHVDFVLPVPIGRYLMTSGYVNDKYHLTGIGYFAADNSTDKLSFHNLLSSVGARNINCKLIHRDSFSFGSWKNYPAILKPRYVSGTEYGVDGAVMEGVLHISLIRKKTNLNKNICQAVSYLAVDKSDRIYELVKQKLSKAVQILQYNHCMLHADVLVEQGEVFIIEISPRPSGHNLQSHFIPKATGIDLAEEYVKFLLGQPYRFETEHVECMQIQYIAFENVVINHVPDMETARTATGCDIVSWNVNIVPGEYMKQITDGHSLMSRGNFIVRGKDGNDAVRQCELIKKQFI